MLPTQRAVLAGQLDNAISQRRWQNLQFSLIILFVLIMMNTNTNQNDSSKFTTSSTFYNENNGASKMSPTYLHELNSITSVVTDNDYKVKNVTGIYKGTFKSSNSSAESLDTGNVFIQLKSFPVKNVENFEYIYGVIKFFGTDKSDLIIPIQGFSFPNKHLISLMSTKDEADRIFLKIHNSHNISNSTIFMEEHRDSLLHTIKPETRMSKTIWNSFNRFYHPLDDFSPVNWYIFNRANNFASKNNSTLNNVNTSAYNRRRLASEDDNYPFIKSITALDNSRLDMYVIDIDQVQQYYDSKRKNISLLYENNFFNPDLIESIGSNMIPSKFKYFQNSITYPSYASPCQFTISLNPKVNVNSKANNNGMDNEITKLYGTLSSDCGLNLNITSISYDAEIKKMYHKTLIYSSISIAICFIQIGLTIYQIKYAENQAIATKMSILSICNQSLIDAIICVSQLFLSASLPKTYIVVVFGLKLFLFSIFETKLVISIYQARSLGESDSLTSVQDLRRTLATFHLRFYAVLFLIVIVISLFHRYLWLLVFLIYSYNVPQIVLNIIRGTRNSQHPAYYIGMWISRLFIPLYFICCPDNFVIILLEEKSFINFNASMLFVFWGTLQVFVLFMQDKFGSRFFLPRSMFPISYDYYRVIPVKDEEISTQLECVICYNIIEARKNDYMIAPCDHIFHKACLQQWMNVKLECAICREKLPPLIEE